MKYKGTFRGEEPHKTWDFTEGFETRGDQMERGQSQSSVYKIKPIQCVWPNTTSKTTLTPTGSTVQSRSGKKYLLKW